MQNPKCFNCGFSFPINEVQIDLFCCNCGELREDDLTLKKKESISCDLPIKKNSTKVIDGVMPFFEVYCKGIRERKDSFSINVERVYHKNGHLDFIYTLDD